jgi:hypothetical protein
MNKSLVIILTLLSLLISCKFKDTENNVESKISKTEKTNNNASVIAIHNSNKQYLKDSLLLDNLGIIDNYFSKYQPDTWSTVIYTNAELKEDFEGIIILKGIKIDKPNDTAFVMPLFNYCDDGESYCFYDKTLPRLNTHSYCCHPDNLFVCSDIDEDGLNEIGIYYSSCSSRYKSLRIFSLKNGQWKEIGSSEFDILTQDPKKVRFDQLVKKVSKGTFEICNFIDGQTKWETIMMK